MALTRFPIDQKAFGQMMFLSAIPVFEYIDGELSDRPRADDDGRPLYKVEVLVKVPGQERHEIVQVRVAEPNGKNPAETLAGKHVIFDGFVGSFWANDSGRAGVTFMADLVHPSNGTAAKAS